MRWEDERYVRLYTRDTITWKMLPWQSRALLPNLIRKVDRAGLLELSEGENPAEAIAVLTDFPVEVVAPGLDGLAKRGVIHIAPSVLVVPKFLEAQEALASGAQRSREWRARRRELAGKDEMIMADPPEQTGDETSRGRDVVSRTQDEASRLRDGTQQSATPSLAVPSCTVLKEGGVDPAPLALAAAPPAPAEKATCSLQALWNELATPNLPAWKENSGPRLKAAKARLRERTIEQWREVIERVATSSFCRGQNDRAWVATPDWLLRPDTATRVLEGKYDNREPLLKRGIQHNGTDDEFKEKTKHMKAVNGLLVLE